MNSVARIKGKLVQMDEFDYVLPATNEESRTALTEINTFKQTGDSSQYLAVTGLFQKLVHAKT